METLDCPCGAHLEADADDDLLAINKEHAEEQLGGDTMYSDMELEAEIERSADEEDDR